MKRFIIVLIALCVFCFSAFGLTFKTGESMKYFPVSAAMVGNKSGDRSNCFVTKIVKANGYTNGVYEVQLTSCDWVGSSVFPIVFSYFLKTGDSIELMLCESIYTPEKRKLVVKSISENEIILEEEKSEFGEINPTEDSL